MPWPAGSAACIVGGTADGTPGGGGPGVLATVGGNLDASQASCPAL